MFGARLHVVGQRRHLDVGVGVPAEMPVAAFVVGQHRIDRRVVEVQHFLAGIAVVVLGHEVLDRGRERRAVALGDEADAGVDRLLHLDQAFLRVELVVVGDDLELLAQDAALGVGDLGEIVEGLEADLADAGAAARERIDVGELDGVIGPCRRWHDDCGCRGCGRCGGAKHGGDARCHGRSS